MMNRIFSTETENPCAKVNWSRLSAAPETFEGERR